MSSQVARRSEQVWSVIPLFLLHDILYRGIYLTNSHNLARPGLLLVTEREILQDVHALVDLHVKEPSEVISKRFHNYPMSQLLQYYKSFQSPKNNNTAPTFEDLSIDDNLSELDRVVRYVKSSIGLQRLVHVKMLSHVAMSVGFEMTNEHIIPVLEQLSVDFEPAIRSHLCEQMVNLATCIAENGGEEGYQVVLDVILPIIALLLEDSKVDVRQAASVALVAVAQIIQSPDLGQHVLTIILQLAHEDENEEMRMTASELLNLLAEHLGLDLCKQFVIPEVVSLAEDPVFRVRKSTALNFENVCKVGGEFELFERLMPAFVRLSKDDMYRVRRACAENLCEVSKHVSNDIRTGVLVEIFLRLAQDPSKLVKQSILQQSGMFISTLPARAINSIIMGHYCSMTNNPTGDLSVDNELKHYCAYSFPGVLQTVGVERWGELRQVYHSLVQSPSLSVKETLATSLHEIAKILGENLAEEELVAVFEEMIQDAHETVRLGIVKHLADFLRLLSMPCRVSYLPLLDDILQSTSPFNWRLRQSLAAQLPELMTLPPPQNVFSTLFPLAMTLLQDPVAEVRIESFKGISKLMLVLQPGGLNKDSSADECSVDSGAAAKMSPTEAESVQYLDAVARAINALVYGETFMHRGLWAELGLQLLRELPRHMFEKYFIDGILQLTGDSVANVRICVAQLLTGWKPTHPSPLEPNSTAENCPWVWLLEKEEVRDCFRRLAKDDNDVYVALSKVSQSFPAVHFVSYSCRGLKRAPGELFSYDSGDTELREGPHRSNDVGSHVSSDVSIDVGRVATAGASVDSIPPSVSTLPQQSTTEGVTEDFFEREEEELSEETEEFTLLSLTEAEQQSLEDMHSLIDPIDKPAEEKEGEPEGELASLLKSTESTKMSEIVKTSDVEIKAEDDRHMSNVLIPEEQQEKIQLCDEDDAEDDDKDDDKDYDHNVDKRGGNENEISESELQDSKAVVITPDVEAKTEVTVEVVEVVNSKEDEETWQQEVDLRTEDCRGQEEEHLGQEEVEEQLQAEETQQQEQNISNVELSETSIVEEGSVSATDVHGSSNKSSIEAS